MTDAHLAAPDQYAGTPFAGAPEALRELERLIWTHRPQVAIVAGSTLPGVPLWARDRLFDAQRYRAGPAPRIIVTNADLEGLRGSVTGLPPEATAGIAWEPTPVLRDNERVMLILDAESAEDTVTILTSHGPTVGREGCILILRADDGAVRRWRQEDPIGRRFTGTGPALTRADPA